MNDLLILAPNRLVIALINYACLYLLFRIVRRYVRKWLHSTERNKAIWQHYQNRAAGTGHGPESVLECADGSCAIF